MTTILPYSRFIHIPKTGGTWVSKMLIDHSGLEVALTQIPHPTTRTSPGQGLFTFAFVRNPLTWYQSYWKYKFKTNHWNPYRTLDAQCQADTFHKFLDNVIEKCPGFYSDFLIQYVGKESDPIDFIGKQENLVEDFLEAMSISGEHCVPKFEEIVRNSAPINVGPKNIDTYPPGYAEKIYQLEKYTFKRFDYGRHY